MALHPLGDLPLPGIVDRLVERIRSQPDKRREAWQRAHLALRPLPDADSMLMALAFGTAHEPTELMYEGHPFEFVPLFWNGGDALQYGLVWYDAALPPVFASYAPSDDGAVWLGDDATEGVANLLGWYALGRLSDTDAERYRIEGAALAEALGLPLRLNPALTKGARTEREVVPTLPKGWRWEPGPRGVGTVAPEGAFGPDLGDLGGDPESWDEAGRSALAAGHPGMALHAFREAHFCDEYSAATALAMAEAYRALGRHPLAARAERYASLQS